MQVTPLVPGGELERTAQRLRARAQGQTPPAFAVPESSALPGLARIFHLGPEELELVTLAAGYEIAPEVTEAIEAIPAPGKAHGGLDASVAADLLGPAAWDLLCAEAALRRWRVVELAGSGPLQRRQLRLDERILHYLLGTSYLDARLEGLVERVAPGPVGGAAGERIAQAIAAAWSGP